MRSAIFEIDLDAPLITPRKSPAYRMEEALDQINHAFITVEDSLKLGVPLGDRRNTILSFMIKAERILARRS